jgi:hypothetical protein
MLFVFPVHLTTFDCLILDGFLDQVSNQSSPGPCKESQWAYNTTLPLRRKLPLLALPLHTPYPYIKILSSLVSTCRGKDIGRSGLVLRLGERARTGWTLERKRNENGKDSKQI